MRAVFKCFKLPGDQFSPFFLLLIHPFPGPRHLLFPAGHRHRCLPMLEEKKQRGFYPPEEGRADFPDPTGANIR
jgi:hypothetical protein